MTTVIKNGTIVTGGDRYVADLMIEGETISAIGRGLIGDREVDAAGCLLFPGFIDVNTHLDMPAGATVTSDSFTTGSLAALIGGTTTIIDFAAQKQGESLFDTLREWHNHADRHCSCDYGFHMTITDWNERTREELHKLAEAGITSFKVYLSGGVWGIGDSQLLDILYEMKKLGCVLGAHCENTAVIERLSRDAVEAGHTGPDSYPKTRPDLTEGEAVGRLLRLAGIAGVPVCVLHLSTEDAMNEVRAARARGQKVFVESCPQYLLLGDELYDQPGFEGAKYVCAPPLRSVRDRKALWRALVSREINIIASDHCAFHFRGQKDLGRDDFREIPKGLPGIEHRGVLMYTAAVAGGKISPSILCRVLSETPARVLGLYPRKGILAPGSDADIVIYDPNASQVITAEGQHQRCDYTPYEGFRTVGAVRDVFLRGVEAVKGGRLLVRGSGHFLPRGKGQVVW